MLVIHTMVPFFWSDHACFFAFLLFEFCPLVFILCYISRNILSFQPRESVIARHCLWPFFFSIKYFWYLLFSWLWRKTYPRLRPENVLEVPTDSCATASRRWWRYAKNFWSTWGCKDPCGWLLFIFKSFH